MYNVLCKKMQIVKCEKVFSTIAKIINFAEKQR